MTLKNRVLVFDARSMRFDDWNGHLRVGHTNLTKANVCEYYGFEINNCRKYGLDPDKKYRFLRSPEALEKAVSSFKERPILYVHKAADANHLDNSKVIGTTGSDPVFEYPYIQSSITIWDGDYIQAIKNNTQAELSASYAFTPVMNKGKFEGEDYDGMMTNIFVDHVALVAEGRAGPDVRVADEKVKRNMPKFNEIGDQLYDTLMDHIDPEGKKQIDPAEIKDAVASISGVKRKHLKHVLQALLSRKAGAMDEDPEYIEDTVQRAVDSLSQDYSNIQDEDPVDLLDTDDCAPAKGKQEQAEDCQCSSNASDSASFVKNIEKRVMLKAKQAQEARLLVKPLVGEWAITEDSGETILRTALKELTGKTPPSDMSYNALKYSVDIAISQKQSFTVNDSRRVKQNDLQRFGAERLRSI